MPMNCERTGILANGMMRVRMGRQASARSHFDSVRSGIGIALRSLHSDMLREPLP
jgi:hypothetical protein